MTTSAPGKVKILMARLGMTLFFGAFLAMGLLFLFLMGRDLIKTVATYSWKETPATILASSVTEAKKGNEPFSVAVSFKYQWEGRSYTSDRYQTSPETDSEYAKVYGQIVDLPTGTLTHCYVDPRDPGQAVLRRKSLGTAFFLLLPLVFIAMGGGMVAKIWIPFSLKAKPLSSQNTLGQGWGTLLGGVLFTLVGAGLLVLWFLPALNRSLASASWTETPCTVISSRVKSHKDSDGTTYSIDIFYRYKVDGKEFKSNAYGHFGGSSSGYKSKAKVVAKYREGTQQKCYVNPKNPAEAVLKPGVGWEVFLGLFPLLFLGVGIFLLFVSRKKSTGPQVISAQSLTPPGSVEVGALVLKAQAPPVARFFGILVFVLIWNGVVTVFLWDVVDGFRSGSPDWFLTLFMTPFVAIGLGGIGLLAYTALALTNPRCRLQVTPGVLLPGATSEVAWTVGGSAGRLQRLRVVLEGREEAIYRRGTSTCTDRHTFARIPVADVSSSLEIIQGEARFRVPEGVPPSFQASNNKIIWSFRVHGEIARWPDVLEEFEVTVTGGKS